MYTLRMYSIEELVLHLKNSHGISVAQNQISDLRNISYYHGYKGYRFIRSPHNKIAFTDLRQIVALNRFDMDLKSLVYPKIMFIENALKSYFLESLLADSQAEELSVIYKKSLTNYKKYKCGSREYKKEYARVINLQTRINSALMRDYNQGKEVVNHFFNNDRPIPVWAVFESLTLGEFGTFFSCANKDIRVETSKLLGLPTNYDGDGNLISFIIYTLRDLRNAIAHNGVIFDTRFKNAKVNSQLKRLLERETKIENLEFKYFDTYIVFIAYIFKKMTKGTKECKSFLHEYNKFCEALRANIGSEKYYFEILGSNHKTRIEKIENYIQSV